MDGGRVVGRGWLAPVRWVGRFSWYVHGKQK